MTHDELLDRMLYYTNNKAAVAVFEHGTCVAGILREDAVRPFGEIAREMLRIYENIPKDGEGSPLGDFGLQDMDDGNTVIAFSDPWYHYCTVRSKEEMAIRPVVATSATEVFLPAQQDRDIAHRAEPVPREAMLEALHGLAARAARSKDAREKRIVRLWDPRGHSLRVEVKGR
jgi:hypothetical protein